MFSKLAVLLMSMVGLALMAVTPSQAAVIDVNTTADQAGMAPGCSLRQAIRAADLDFAQGGCPAGVGADTIRLPGGNYTLTIPGTGDSINEKGDLNVQGMGALAIIPATASPVVIDAGGLDRVLQHGGPGQLTLKDLTIRGGHLEPNSDGGGILNEGGLLELDGVTVSGNSALNGAGGGIYNETSVSILNSTISGNSAKQGGGGYFGTMASVGNFRSVTIFGNTADLDGTNSGNGGGIAASGTVNSFNTVIAGNVDNSPAVLNRVPDCSTGPNFFPRYTLIGVPSPAQCLKGFDPGTNMTGDPKLGPLGEHGGPAATHVPLDGSPLIDSGGTVAPDLCPISDQRGVSRPQGAGCDLGAVELDPAGLDKPDAPSANKAILKLKKAGRKAVRSRPGKVATLRIKVRNTGDIAAKGTKVCLIVKGKSKKAIKSAGKRCRKYGSIQPAAGRVAKAKLKVKKGAAAGRKKVRIVVKSRNAETRRLNMTIRVR
ncbi:MAG: right-handed parallel beta-helix repeat-containing protein [Solirubrobacterales bacterium]